MMRSLFTVFFVSVCCSSYGFRIGAVGGVNVASHHYDIASVQIEVSVHQLPVWGYHAGIRAYQNVFRNRWLLEASVLYSTTGSYHEGYDLYGTAFMAFPQTANLEYDFSSLYVPFHVVYAYPFHVHELRLKLGMYMNFPLFATRKVTPVRYGDGKTRREDLDFQEYRVKPLDYGLSLGISFFMADHIEFYFSYGWGISKIGEEIIPQNGWKVYKTKTEEGIAPKNRILSVGAGYYF